MLTIRLQRVGRKNQPVFRIVLAEKYRAAQKKIVEALGLYNPRNKEFTIKEERVKYWLEKHVEVSPTVHNLFATHKLVSEKKVQAWRPKKSTQTIADQTQTKTDEGGQAKTETTPSPQSSPPGGEEVKAEPKAEAAPATT